MRARPMLSLLAEFDDWCGTRWSYWPGPRPKSVELDPLVIVIADRAIGGLHELGSYKLHEGLVSVRDEVASGKLI